MRCPAAPLHIRFRSWKIRLLLIAATITGFIPALPRFSKDCALGEVSWEPFAHGPHLCAGEAETNGARDGARDAAEAPAEKPPICLRCNGTTKIECPRCQGTSKLYKPCPICSGSGKRICPSCKAYRDKAELGPGKRPCITCRGKDPQNGAKACFRCRGAKFEICDNCLGHGDLDCAPKIYDRSCPDCTYIGSGKINCPECSSGNATPILPVDARTKEIPELAGKQGPGEITTVTSIGKEAPIGSGVVEMERLSLRDQIFLQIDAIKESWPATTAEYNKIEAALNSQEVIKECLQQIDALNELGRIPAIRDDTARAESVDRLKKTLFKIHSGWSNAMEAFEKLQRSYQPASDQIQAAYSKEASLSIVEGILEQVKYHTTTARANIKKFAEKGIAPKLLLDQLEEAKVEIGSLREVARAAVQASQPRSESGEATADAGTGEVAPELAAGGAGAPPPAAGPREYASESAGWNPFITTIAVLLALCGILVSVLALRRFRGVEAAPEAVKVDPPPFMKHRPLPRPPVRRVAG